MLPGLSSSAIRHQRQTGQLLSACKGKHLYLNVEISFCHSLLLMNVNLAVRAVNRC